MKFTIHEMEHKEYDEGDNVLIGYAFIDEDGHCIIIVYGEKKRDLIKRYLSHGQKDTNPD